MTWLLTADLHLTDRPKDSYRFGLFRWLRRQQQDHTTTATFILGDITDRKDNHSSALVNKIVEELLSLKPPIYILRGNHDCIDPTNPYFGFLSYIEGVHFVTEPTLLREYDLAMIPHQRDESSFAQTCASLPASHYMLHQTFDGAIAETGGRLTGFSTSPIDLKQPLRVWAGDIHRPQTVNCVAYVGSPFQVRFGDDFTPRVLLVRNTIERDLFFPCLKKWSLTMTDPNDLHSYAMQRGDQVKITMRLTREEVVGWAAQRRAVLAICKSLGVDVFGLDMEVIGGAGRRVKVKVINPADVFNAFCVTENVASNVKQVGQEILKDV
jgi:hypothetical protein